jgi:hypothetical protein
MSDRITAASAFRWCRDHAARIIGSFTAFTFMWIAVGIAVAVGFYWDGIWARNQAAAGLEDSFQAGGWVVRIWTVFALVGVVALFRQGAKVLGGLFFVTWLMTSIMAYGHVLGFIATGQNERYAAGAAVENVVEISNEGLDDKLALIATQKEQIRADRDADVAALERALDALINDGSAANDAEATAQYTPLIQGVRNDARAELQALDAQERELTLANTETKLQANQEQVTAVKFDPLYVWVAGWFMPDQSDASLRVVAQRIGAFWAFLIEFIAGAGPAMLYAAHSHFSDRRAAEEKDPTRVEAGKKAAETRNRRKRQTLKIQEQAESYLPAWEKAVRYANIPSYTAKGIRQTAFPNISIDHVIEVLRKANAKGDWRPALEEEINLVKRLTEPPQPDESKKYAVDVINPDPASTNGTGHSLEQDADNADDTDTAGSVPSN